MPDLGGDYWCLATMEVPAGQVDQYNQLLCAAADVFTRHDWRLVVAAEKAALFETSGAPPGLQRRLLHVWSIPTFDSLTGVMAYAADNPNYVEAQSITIDEAQNLYVVQRWANPIGLPDTPVNFYMVEILQIVNGVKVRNDFANYMNDAVYKMNTSYGWKILFAGNAATGIIDQYVNIWGMTDILKLEAGIKEYRSDARWTAAVTQVSTSLWVPRPLPCFENLGGGKAFSSAASIAAAASAVAAAASAAAAETAAPSGTTPSTTAK
jgi:hypothetical protein